MFWWVFSKYLLINWYLKYLWLLVVLTSWASLIAQLLKNPPAMQETLVRFLGQKEGIGYPLQYFWASLVAQLVKNPAAMRETWVWSLGWEGPLEKAKTTHSSILTWRSMYCIVHELTKSWTWQSALTSLPQLDSAILFWPSQKQQERHVFCSLGWGFWTEESVGELNQTFPFTWTWAVP